MAVPAYAPPPGSGMMMEPSELHTVRTMLKWARILALIIAIVDVLAFIGAIAFAVIAAAAAVPFVSVYIGPAIFYIAVVIVSFLIWMKIGEIEKLVNQGQFQAAKDKTLLWMILGFIFGWIIVGILLLLAYTKYDTLINFQRQTGFVPGATPMMATAPGMAPMGGGMGAGGMAPPSSGMPPSSTSQPPSSGGMAAPTSPPMTNPSGSAGVICPKCGNPATYIPQYNRYYCYQDQQYV